MSPKISFYKPYVRPFEDVCFLLNLPGHAHGALTAESIEKRRAAANQAQDTSATRTSRFVNTFAASAWSGKAHTTALASYAYTVGDVLFGTGLSKVDIQNKDTYPNILFTWGVAGITMVAATFGLGALSKKAGQLVGGLTGLMVGTTFANGARRGGLAAQVFTFVAFGLGSFVAWNALSLIWATVKAVITNLGGLIEGLLVGVPKGAWRAISQTHAPAGVSEPRDVEAYCVDPPKHFLPPFLTNFLRAIVPEQLFYLFVDILQAPSSEALPGLMQKRLPDIRRFLDDNFDPDSRDWVMSFLV